MRGDNQERVRRHYLFPESNCLQNSGWNFVRAGVEPSPGAPWVDRYGRKY